MVEQEWQKRFASKVCSAEQTIRTILPGRRVLIGSGAAEGCCKHLVKQRFGISGARWKRGRIAPVLALRLSIFNDQWDQDWSRN